MLSLIICFRSNSMGGKDHMPKYIDIFLCHFEIRFDQAVQLLNFRILLCWFWMSSVCLCGKQIHFDILIASFMVPQSLNTSLVFTFLQLQLPHWRVLALSPAIVAWRCWIYLSYFWEWLISGWSWKTISWHLAFLMQSKLCRLLLI